MHRDLNEGETSINGGYAIGDNWRKSTVRESSF
jgi:hypothetical protein